ncbi:hypothetical protein HanPI659440_Chr11g0423471 [Helianthus annuus]|nr:hypothetical protein HanPI659440_Chr11g0423471 [Helianthus annuus]
MVGSRWMEESVQFAVWFGLWVGSRWMKDGCWIMLLIRSLLEIQNVEELKIQECFYVCFLQVPGWMLCSWFSLFFDSLDLDV